MQGELLPTPNMNWIYPLRTFSHRIDESSPLFGKTAEALRDESGYISICLSGVDDHFCEVRCTIGACTAHSII